MESQKSFMEIIQDIVGVTSDFLWAKLLIVLLLSLGVFYTLFSRFVQIRWFKEMIVLLADKGTISTKGSKAVSSFQAFTISTASRVGTGNLAGVATAIAGGGPGAVFWMWLIALLGGASSFIESTLAQIYKVKDENGFRGGPAYYMEKGLNMRWLGIIFAVIITFCFGLVFNSVQSNTISLAFEEAFGMNRSFVGMILAILTAVIIFGGVHRVARVTQVIVPGMAILYLLLAIIVLLMNVTEIPGMIRLIFENAFGLREVVSGGVGAAIMMGIKRGLFSNEAGMGSAPNAAATAAVSHPVKQGFIQTLGVFTDTLLICSATAFLIILSGAYTTPDLTGIQLTQVALSEHVGSWASLFVAIAIFLFAFSSIVGNYYYGETNIEFIRKSKLSMTVYRVGVVAMVMFGAVSELNLVWSLADLFMGLMVIINLVAITLLSKVAIAALKDYEEQRKKGKDPVFYADSLPNVKGIDAWDVSPSKKKQAM
jgi:alanine or glycine:cation symporter, AGCS family